VRPHEDGASLEDGASPGNVREAFISIGSQSYDSKHS